MGIEPKICSYCQEKNNPGSTECWSCHHFFTGDPAKSPLETARIADPKILKKLKRLSWLRNLHLGSIAFLGVVLLVCHSLSCSLSDTIPIFLIWVIFYLATSVMIFSAICPNCGGGFYRWALFIFSPSYWPPYYSTCFCCGINLKGLLPPKN